MWLGVMILLPVCSTNQLKDYKSLKGTIHPALLGVYAMQIALLVTELFRPLTLWVMEWLAPIVTSLVFITLVLIGKKWTNRITFALVIICLLFIALTALAAIVHYPALRAIALFFVELAIVVVLFFVYANVWAWIESKIQENQLESRRSDWKFLLYCLHIVFVGGFVVWLIYTLGS